MRALILGYGSAGKRHSQLLDDLNIKWRYHDPYTEDVGNLSWCGDDLTSDITDLDEPIKEAYDFVVICSPPNTHLEYIERASEIELPVLCEKPLCDYGQIENWVIPDNARVMLAFNYRFHPTWVGVKHKLRAITSEHFDWAFLARQVREEIPEWSLIYENLSHTIDQALWLSEKKMSIERVKERRGTTSKMLMVRGQLGRKIFTIWNETFWSELPTTVEPFSGILTPLGFVSPDGNLHWEMFLNMYRHFLDCLHRDLEFSVPLSAGVEVQKLLDTTYETIYGKPQNNKVQ